MSDTTQQDLVGAYLRGVREAAETISGAGDVVLGRLAEAEDGSERYDALAETLNLLAQINQRILAHAAGTLLGFEFRPMSELDDAVTERRAD